MKNGLSASDFETQLPTYKNYININNMSGTFTQQFWNYSTNY